MRRSSVGRSAFTITFRWGSVWRRMLVSRHMTWKRVSPPATPVSKAASGSNWGMPTSMPAASS